MSNKNDYSLPRSTDLFLHETSVHGLLKQCATSVKGLVLPADIKIIAKNIHSTSHWIETIAE
jgi:hypothetical protein